MSINGLTNVDDDHYRDYCFFKQIPVEKFNYSEKYSEKLFY